MTMNWTEGFDPLEVFRAGETLFRAGKAEEARAEFRRFLSFYRCASSPPADTPVPDETDLMPVTFWMPLDSVIGPILVVSRLLAREAEKCRAAALLLQTLTPAGANLLPDTPEHCDRLWAALMSDTSALAGTLPEALPATRAATVATVLDRLVRHSPAVAGDDALLVLLARALREIPLHDVAAGIEGHLTARIFQLSGLFPASVRHDPRSFAGAMFALDWLRRVDQSAAQTAAAAYNAILQNTDSDANRAQYLWEQLDSATSGWDGADPAAQSGLVAARANPYRVVERLRRRDPQRAGQPSYAFFSLHVFAMAGDLRARAIAQSLAELKPRSQALAEYLATILLRVVDRPAASRMAARAEALRIAARRRAAARGSLLVLFEPMLWSFGDTAMRLDLVHHLRRDGLIDWFPLVIDATPQGNPRGISNPYLLAAWEKFFPIVRDPALLDLVKSAADTTQRNDMWYSMIQTESYYCAHERGYPPTLALSPEEESWGQAELTRCFGIEPQTWFCCFHIRGLGWYGDAEFSEKGAKTADPLTYLTAMRAVVAAGGVVFRLGDPTMAPLPTMEGVIDIAHSPSKSGRLDLFLCAAARFMVSTCSGPGAVASAYGVPLVVTNAMPIDSGALRPGDLYLHKLVRRRSDGRPVPFVRLLKPPYQNTRQPADFFERGYELSDNTEDEIAEATKEMIALLAGSDPFSQEDKARQEFYRAASVSPPWPLGLVGRPSGYFLRKHDAILRFPESAKAEL